MSTNVTVDSTSAELVSTPFGLHPKSNVHAVPEGARVNHTATHVQIIAADGAIIHSTPVSDKVSTHLPSTGLQTDSRTFLNGSAATAFWTNSNSSQIANFSTTWTVPLVPEKKDGAIYILTELAASSILYCALQFGNTGAGGGEYWAISSWYYGGGHMHYSPLEKVVPGQSITGVMTLKNSFSSGSETTYNWNAMFSMLPSTSLNVSIPGALTYAYESLQISHVSDSSGLPPGYTIMGSINLALVDGSHPSEINWIPIINAAQGFGLEIISNSSRNGAIKIIYSDSVNV